MPTACRIARSLYCRWVVLLLDSTIRERSASRWCYLKINALRVSVYVKLWLGLLWQEVSSRTILIRPDVMSTMLRFSWIVRLHERCM
jgi:hypothetical protein